MLPRGRFASVHMAHFHAASLSFTRFLDRPPWPTMWRIQVVSYKTNDFWPASLFELCIPNKRPDRTVLTGSKREQGTIALVEDDLDGDEVQPPVHTRSFPGKLRFFGGEGGGGLQQTVTAWRDCRRSQRSQRGRTPPPSVFGIL